MAQKEWIFPIAPSVRIVRDCITYCAKNMKRYNPINISGYHISEAGASPLDEVAFTLCNLVTYVDEVTKTGMHVDEFAPRLAFYYRLPVRLLRGDRQVPRGTTRLCEDHARALRRAEPRVDAPALSLPDGCGVAHEAAADRSTSSAPACQALAAVLGGAQSLHTNGMDEAFAIPTEEAMKIALRTQQIIADETGVASVVDPLGGSYFVERLTTQFERRIFEVLDEVERRGGTVRLIDEGWFQQRIAGFRVRDRQAEGQRGKAGDRREQARRARSAFRSRDPSVRPDDRRAPDRAARARAPRARQRRGRHAAGPAGRGRRRRTREHSAGDDRAGPTRARRWATSSSA